MSAPRGREPGLELWRATWRQSPDSLMSQLWRGPPAGLTEPVEVSILIPVDVARIDHLDQLAGARVAGIWGALATWCTQFDAPGVELVRLERVD